MKKVIQVLFLFGLIFALGGCSYKIVKTNESQTAKSEVSQSESDKQFNEIWNADSNSTTTNNEQQTKDSNSNTQAKQIGTSPVVSVDLQTKCATAAEEFFTKNGYRDKSEFSFSYQNHFNLKLNKCFILVSSSNFKDDSLFVDLYDALESKYYAMYLGHSNCDAVSLSLTNSPKKCQMDAGNIWYDGDDTKKSDYTVGFQGLLNGGGMGDANTFKQFMEQVKPFMND